MPHLISPSILAADPLNLWNDIDEVERGGADWHHLDVMDGHFVPNLTFGPHLIKALRKKSRKLLDVHLMVSNPLQVAKDYIVAGADILTFHLEALASPQELIKKVRNSNIKVGLSIKPKTSIEALIPFVSQIDLFLIMGVEPGFGGQTITAETFDRLKVIKKHRDESGSKALISVDGGVTIENSRDLVSCGAQVLVAGSCIYNFKNRQKQISLLR